MHSYSIDSDIRKKVYFGIFVISLAIPTAFEKIRMATGLPAYLAFPASFSTLFGILYFSFNHYLWKFFPWLTSIPDLAGEWEAKGVKELLFSPTSVMNFHPPSVHRPNPKFRGYGTGEISGQ